MPHIMFKTVLATAFGSFIMYRHVLYYAQVYEIKTYQKFITHKNMYDEYRQFYISEFNQFKK